MKYIKVITLTVLAVLMMFVSIDIGNQQFLEFGQKVDAATNTNEWTIVQSSMGYMHYSETTASFLITGTTAKVRFNCPITGGPDKIVFMEFNDLNPLLYEYYFVIEYNGWYEGEVFWSYNVDFSSYGASSPQFRSASVDTEYNAYYFKLYKRLKNQVPTIISLTQGNETFSMA